MPTLKEALEKYKDKYICLDIGFNRYKGYADDLAKRFDLWLDGDVKVDETGSDYYDIYLDIQSIK